MKPKISVIIPCYNVEKYIKRCMESIVNQTLGIENLQIILVNDSSTDDTLKILYDYEKIYTNNIYIINLPQNMGQGYARNEGLNYADAQLIYFMDSDDWIELDCLEKMINKLNQYECDIVMCKNDRPSDEDDITIGKVEEDKIFFIDDIEKRKNFLSYYRFDIVCWNKLIKKSILIENNILFPEGLKFEDNFWGYLLFFYVKRIYILEDCLYHWFYNPNSTVTSGKHILDRTDVQILLLNECRRRGLTCEFKEEIEYNFYEKFFIETIFFLLKYNIISIKLLSGLKDMLKLSINNICENFHYKYNDLSSKSNVESIIRKLYECKIDKKLIDEVMNEFSK